MDGEQLEKVSETFHTGGRIFVHDRAIAIDDERADGVLYVAGFIVTPDGDSTPWQGYITRRAGAPLLAEVEPDDTPIERAPEPTEEEGEDKGERGGDAPQPQAEDELTQLIHAIAGGRDEILVESLGSALRDKVESMMAEFTEAANAKLADIAESGLVIKTQVQVDELPPVELKAGETVHRDLAMVLALIRAGAKNVMLVGPAGCGKTTLARQVAHALNHGEFAAISCSPGMSEAKVLGRVGMPTPTNETGYLETAVMRAFRLGGTILFDEMDNADASMMVSFNAMTDGGFATLPTGETVPRHPDTVIIAACNTFGHGADRLYVGRNQLDAATLDRFVGATVEMDYDRDLEKMLCPEHEIRDAVWKIRDAARKNGLRRVVSTRAMTAARRRRLSLKESLHQVNLAITLGWSKQDRAAVGVLT